MATGNRSGTDSLTHLERLTEAPEKFHFFHAFRVLEAAYPDSARIGESRRPREEQIRFGQDADLRFAPSATLAPLQYFELPVATVFGFLVFNDFPNAMSLLGIAIIIGAVMYQTYRRTLQRILAKRAPK